jgi:DNA-binding transcriptional MerR regulator
VSRTSVKITGMTEPATPGYTIADLARLGGVTPRTVRYYVAQGLLPSPGSLGPATRYGEAQLARLRLIRRLQRRHLPLAEIRSQLNALSDGQVRSALAAADAPPTRPDRESSALDYVHEVLRSAPDGRREWPGRPMRAVGRLSGSFPATDPTLDAGLARRQPPPRMTFGIAEPMLGPRVERPPDRSQWERIRLAPDVELHIRRPLSRQVNKRVERLVEIAREILEEDRP